MGVLEGQEHVLEDGQGGAPDNGIQKLGENLEKKNLVRSPTDLGHPRPSVATGLKGGQRHWSQSSRPMREPEHRGAHRLGWMDSR